MQDGGRNVNRGVTCGVKPSPRPKVAGAGTHGLFLKLHNLSNRQDAKVAKTNKFDVYACGETTSGKLGVLGVLAVKNAAYVVLQEKTMDGTIINMAAACYQKPRWRTMCANERGKPD